MRRLAAVVIMVVFASLNAVDGVCCPDGCTHEQEASSRPQSPPSLDGMCVLCIGGVNTSAREDLFPVALTAGYVVSPPVTNPGDVPPDPPEHPPRS